VSGRKIFRRGFLASDSMGRHPVPTAIKLARGNPGQRPINSDEPTPPPADCTPPATLSEVGIEKWVELTDLLTKMGVFTLADRSAVERYCLIHEQWMHVVKHVRENGMTQITQTGYSQLTAEGSLFKSLPSDLLKLEQQFGMTPAARSSLKVADAAAPADPLDAYIKSRRA
jgi:P27 family predicted phage terminase small subunit